MKVGFLGRLGRVTSLYRNRQGNNKGKNKDIETRSRPSQGNRKKAAKQRKTGIQWILNVEQDGNRMAVYCDNYYPKAVVEFSEVLDDVLVDGGQRKVRWTGVSVTEGRAQQSALWDIVAKVSGK